MIYKYIQNSINPISLRQGEKNLSFDRASQIAKLPSLLHPESTKKMGKVFIPRVILLWLYWEPQPTKTPKNPTPQAKNLINWKPLT